MFALFSVNYIKTCKIETSENVLLKSSQLCLAWYTTVTSFASEILLP